MTVWVVLGLGLQLVGIGLAIGALTSTWRRHGEGRQFLPEAAQARSWVQRVILRRQPQRAAVAGGGTAGVTVRADAAVGFAPLAADADIDAIRDVLRRRMAMYDQDIQDLKDALAAHQRTVTERLTQIESESREADDELRGKLAHVAVGSIRLQMAGLILVGIGSVLTVVG
ncbi:UNVERIFIED_ORG: hypothetical protein E4P37_07925 [Bacillus sp. AZ43]